jgi:hypothetical protein
MAWAKGRYYQRSVWESGKVTTHYFGVGPGAFAVSLLEDEGREARAAALAVEQEQRALLEAEAVRGWAACRIVAVLLESLGYAQYQRNPWKRRRRPMRRIELARCGDPGPSPSPVEVRALAERVRKKEPGALAEFTELAERHPVVVADEMASDLAWVAKTTFASKAGGGNGPIAVALEVRIALLIRELAGERPSPALRLVSEATAFAWCEHWTLSAVAAHNDIGRSTPMSWRRQQAALRRFMTTLRTYHQIERLERGR